jgi:hypothetical protein
VTPKAIKSSFFLIGFKSQILLFKNQRYEPEASNNYRCITERAVTSVPDDGAYLCALVNKERSLEHFPGEIQQKRKKCDIQFRE